MAFSNHIDAVCPYCGMNVTFAWVGTSEHGGRLENYLYNYYGNNDIVWAIAQCPRCKDCVLMKGKKTNQGVFSVDNIYPFPLPTKTNELIHEKVREDLDEAKRCLSVVAYRACAVMCRRAIQQACIEKGADVNKNLEKQIDELKDKGIITNQIQSWAHSSRWVGNDAAHPNHTEVTKEDAEDILNLAEQIMNILYVMDELSKRVNKTHEKKKE